MRVTFKILVDDQASTVGFDATTDNGKKLSRLESAHLLSKILAGLIKDGIHESGRQLIVPATPQIPRITS